MRVYGDCIRVGNPGCQFIDGVWRAPRDGVPYALIDPSTEQAHDGFVAGGVADVDDAVRAARRAFDDGGWPNMDGAERARLVASMAEGLEARRAELEEAWTLQVGALPAARGRAVTNGINHFRRAAKQASDYSFEESAETATGRAIVRHEAAGVVAAIASWNGPLLQMASKVGPALVAGCTVVMKPAAQTPIEAILIAECAEAAGIPPGVLNLVLSDNAGADALVSDARVDSVSFTGSTEIGRHIARRCGDRIARYSLELGGKSAAIVLADADIAAVGRTMGRTITALSGQLCTMLSRVIVTADRHDALAEAIAAEMATVKIGSAYEPSSQMGPLASARQLATVERYVGIGGAEGAALVHGGRRPADIDKGFFHEPTLFADVSPDAKIARDEIFGPVLSLIRARDEEHAIEIANASIYGLHGSVFTNDADRARSIARRIRTGSFAQNGMRLDFALPFGGFKQSGVGREGGPNPMDAYLETKVVLFDA